MPLDYTLLSNPQNAPQINNLAMDIQAKRAAVTDAQLQNETSKNGYAAMVLATAGMSGNPALYSNAKKHLESMGVDTSVYSDDPSVGAKQAQLSRMYGATPTAILSAMMQQQQMAQRAGTSVGDPTAFGWSPNQLPGMGGQSPAQQTTPPVDPGMTAPSNGGQTVPVGDMAGAVNNYPSGGVPPAVQEQVGGMVPNLNGSGPARRPNETVESYNSRLNAWKAANEVNPALQGQLEESKAAGADTIKSSGDLSQDASQAQNMLYTLSTMKDAVANFQSGALASAKQSMARAARAAGISLSQQEINSLADKQVFTKLSNDIIGQAAKAEGGASRLNAGFEAIKSSNPNIGMEPETLGLLIDKLGAQSNKIIHEQSEWNNQKTSNPGLSFADFQRKYLADVSKQQEESGGALEKSPALAGKPAPMGSVAVNSAQVGQAVMKLKNKGYSQDQINQYLQHKGWMNAAH